MSGKNAVRTRTNENKTATVQTPNAPPPVNTTGITVAHLSPEVEARIRYDENYMKTKDTVVKDRAKEILRTQYAYWENNNRALLGSSTAILNNALSGQTYKGNPVTMDRMYDYIDDDPEFAWALLKSMTLLKMDFVDYRSGLQRGGTIDTMGVFHLGVEPAMNLVVKDDNIFSNPVTKAWRDTVNTGFKVADTAGKVVDTANNVINGLNNLTNPDNFGWITTAALAVGAFVVINMLR